jgi:hypothetical protein
VRVRFRAAISNPVEIEVGAATAETALSFGPVIERTLRDPREKAAEGFMSFKTGAFVVPPADLKVSDFDALWNWAETNGVDATPNTDSAGRCLELYGGTVGRMTDADWEKLPAVDKIYRALLAEDFIIDSRGGPRPRQSAVMSLQTVTTATNQTRTFAFRARSGAVGLLHFLEYSDSPNGSIKFVYRLIKNAEGDAAKTALIPWGEASAGGLQVRLQTEKRDWLNNETAEFTLGVRNEGKEAITYLGLPEIECQIEVDGVRYGWSKGVVLGHRGVSLAPGQEKTMLRAVTLSGEWARPEKGDAPKWTGGLSPAASGEPLKLAVGRHSVKVVFRAEGGAESAEAISNPVEIEVKERTGGAVNAQGMQLNLEATKGRGRSNEAPEFTLNAKLAVPATEAASFGPSVRRFRSK